MELKVGKGAEYEKDYRRILSRVYAGDPHYRKTMLPVLETLLSGKGAFFQHAEVLTAIVCNENVPVAGALFIMTPRLPGTLQLACFESASGAFEAVKILLQGARKECTRRGLHTILAGLNGHVNYGLGILSESYSESPCFGSAYNPPYYAEYFRRLGMKETALVSYLTAMDRFSLVGAQKLLARAARRYTVRTADFSKLSREVELYTWMNNQCFKNHPYYYERTVEEDYELLKGFRPLIQNQNMLIVEEEGQPVGFMLWYPDFHQIIPPQKGFDPITFLKVKALSPRIRHFKITEIGVLPRHQGTGAAALLFHKCHELTRGRFDSCETGWILEANHRSRGFGIRWADCEYKRYSVFELSGIGP